MDSNLQWHQSRFLHWSCTVCLSESILLLALNTFFPLQHYIFGLGGILEWTFFPNFSFLWGLFFWIHLESVRCQIHISQPNSKGNTGSQTCISDVILIFIAGMVGFRRNSTTTKLAPLGHRVNKHGDPCPSQKHTKQKKTCQSFIDYKWKIPFLHM